MGKIERVADGRHWQVRVRIMKVLRALFSSFFTYSLGKPLKGELAIAADAITTAFSALQGQLQESGG